MNKIIIVLIVLILIESCVSKSSNTESSIQSAGVESPEECNLIFERGFNETNVKVIVNGMVYMESDISTNKSIEVADHLVFNSDTIQTMSLQIDNRHEILLCPTYIMTVNYRDEKLVLKALSEFPIYE